ncbi:MAG TPA: hypothetical protein VKU38_13980 [Ktedonobacteraceae bacterium]|nr:hypothetical protein [Ktedonobacteraceae bacterium]
MGQNRAERGCTRCTAGGEKPGSVRNTANSSLPNRATVTALPAVWHRSTPTRWSRRSLNRCPTVPFIPLKQLNKPGDELLLPVRFRKF